MESEPWKEMKLLITAPQMQALPELSVHGLALMFLDLWALALVPQLPVTAYFSEEYA